MTIEILDYIVKIIESLFYISTGTVALLTYLSAHKTILQPIKTEVFKRQVEVFTAIMDLFGGKGEVEIRRAFGFDKMLMANIFNLLDNYAKTFFDVRIDPNKRPYNKEDCPASMITAEYAKRYLISPTFSPEKESDNEEETQPTVTKKEFWNDYIYGEICQPTSTVKTLKQLDEIMKSPFLTGESIQLLSMIKRTVEKNILRIGEVLTTVAKELPKMCPDISSLKEMPLAAIENEYNKVFISIEPYCKELTDYLRRYFKVESIME